MALSQRSAQMAQIANKLEMQFEAKDEWGLKTLLKDFHLFRRGGRKKILNYMHKSDGWLEMEMHLFDYHYTISTGKSSYTFKQTVFFVQSKRLGLPQFLMKPENFFHKIGHFLGIKDINFEEFPEFSNQYYLKGPDEEFIRAALNEKVLRFFTVEKNWSLEGINYFLIFYCNDTILPPQKILNFYDKGIQLCNMLSTEKE